MTHNPLPEYNGLTNGKVRVAYTYQRLNLLKRRLMHGECCYHDTDMQYSDEHEPVRIRARYVTTAHIGGKLLLACNALRFLFAAKHRAKHHMKGAMYHLIPDFYESLPANDEKE